MYTQRREPFRWSLLALVPTLLLTTSARGQQPQAPGAPTGSVLVRTGDPAPATARFGTAYDSVAAAPDGLAFIDRNRTALFLNCLLYTSPSPRDRQKSRMPSSA